MLFGETILTHAGIIDPRTSKAAKDHAKQVLEQNDAL
jgi:hypothetical protein